MDNGRTSQSIPISQPGLALPTLRATEKKTQDNRY